MFPSGSESYGKESPCGAASYPDSPGPARGIQTWKTRVKSRMCVCAPSYREKRKLGNNTVFLTKQPECLHQPRYIYFPSVRIGHIFSMRTWLWVFFSMLNSVFLWCSQKELREKQSEMGKTVTAAENAINKLQLNTVSIEVSPPHD